MMTILTHTCTAKRGCYENEASASVWSGQNLRYFVVFISLLHFMCDCVQSFKKNSRYTNTSCFKNSSTYVVTNEPNSHPPTRCCVRFVISA